MEKEKLNLFAHNALDPFFGMAFWPLVWVSFSKSPVLEHYLDIFLGAYVSHISPFTKPCHPESTKGFPNYLLIMGGGGA